MSDLAKKHCNACESATEALKGKQIIDLGQKLGGNWQIVNDHHLEKIFTFKDFKEALAFTNRIGAIAEQEGHHPDILLSWGKVIVRIWTHKVDGLTEADFVLAAKLD